MAWALRLLASDFLMTFLWVTSGSLIKVVVAEVLGLSLREPPGEALRSLLAVSNMFLFAWLGIVTSGASYNPLSILSSAIGAPFPHFLFTFLARIPAQMIGSAAGVRLIVHAFPRIGRGPRLNVDIHHGALVEGLMTFMIVVVSMGLKQKDPRSFFLKTWISSISKLTLHILGSDLTGGIMNPASAFGWAFLRGDHMTKEHLFVYWLGPLEGAVLGAWVFSLITQPWKRRELLKGEKENKKSKSE